MVAAIIRKIQKAKAWVSRDWKINLGHKEV